jgi:hypothetical protein
MLDQTENQIGRHGDKTVDGIVEDFMFDGSLHVFFCHSGTAA